MAGRLHRQGRQGQVPAFSQHRLWSSVRGRKAGGALWHGHTKTGTTMLFIGLLHENLCQMVDSVLHKLGPLVLVCTFVSSQNTVCKENGWADDAGHEASLAVIFGEGLGNRSRTS
eukprot:1853186-Amphidinium_carterae.1